MTNPDERARVAIVLAYTRAKLAMAGPQIDPKYRIQTIPRHDSRDYPSTKKWR